MHTSLHIISYWIPLLLVGLAPPLLPTLVQWIPLSISCIFNICISKSNPTPNNDQFFVFYQLLVWLISGCWLASLSKSIKNYVKGLLLIVSPAYKSDVSDIFTAIKTISPLVTIPAISLYIIFLALAFRYLVARDNDDMGFFGKVCTSCWIFVKGIEICRQGFVMGIEICHQGFVTACSSPCRQEDEEASCPPPSYTVGQFIFYIPAYKWLINYLFYLGCYII